jgi:DNA repair exonuclease SbcCD ATPase subunit
MPITITSTVDSLLQQLHTTLAGAVAKLEAERDKLEEESQGIQAAANELKLLLPAKAREAERAADVLLLQGKSQEAAAKIKEQKQAERAPAEMEQRCRAISARIGEIASEKEAIARRCFSEWYPRLRAALILEQTALVDALDAAWTGIVRFSGETGTGGIGGILKASMENDLTARDQGPERAIYGRLVSWFGGRQ